MENLWFPGYFSRFWVLRKQCFQCRKIKIETSFKVFILKEHRKNNLKNIFFPWESGFWISVFGHGAIVLPNVHIVHCKTTTEMQKVIKMAEINFWPKKISTKKWSKNDPKLPKMAQKLAPAKKNSRDISPVSPTFCISATSLPLLKKESKQTHRVTGN